MMILKQSMGLQIISHPKKQDLKKHKSRSSRWNWYWNWNWGWALIQLWQLATMKLVMNKSCVRHFFWSVYYGSLVVSCRLGCLAQLSSSFRFWLWVRADEATLANRNRLKGNGRFPIRSRFKSHCLALLPAFPIARWWPCKLAIHSLAFTSCKAQNSLDGSCCKGFLCPPGW